jgi:hypothetical protein
MNLQSTVSCALNQAQALDTTLQGYLIVSGAVLIGLAWKPHFEHYIKAQ